MPNPMQIRRTTTANNPPPNNSLDPGILAVEMANLSPRLWVGVPTSIDPTGRRVVTDVTRAYVDGLFATVGSGTVTRITTGAGLVGGPITGVGEIALIVPLAVALGGTGVDNLAAAPWLQRSGGTMTGPLLLAGPPVDDLEPVTKLMFDTLVETSGAGVQRIIAGLGLTGGTITNTGTIALEIPVPLTRGGTGAITAAEARENLGITAVVYTAGNGITLTPDVVFGGTAIALQAPVTLANGGTGSTTASGARLALGITLPLPVASGGTGASDPAVARANLGIADITIPLEIAEGGTGGTDLAEAKTNLEIPELPLTVADGGTGVTTMAALQTALNIPALPMAVADGGTGSTTAPLARTALGVDTVPISFSFHGTPNAGDMVNVPVTMNLTIAPDLAGSAYYNAVDPTAVSTFTVTVQPAGSTIGAISKPAGTGAATFAGVGTTTLAPGQTLRLTATTVGASLADVGITLQATRR